MTCPHYVHIDVADCRDNLKRQWDTAKKELRAVKVKLARAERRLAGVALV